MGNATLTALGDVLNDVSRIGIDTAPFIYFFERHPDYIDLLRDLYRRIDTGQVEGVGSVLVLTEVLVQPLRMGNAGLVMTYRDYLTNSRHFSLIPVDHLIGEEAARLRAIHQLRTPDAIHLATAISAGCQLFITNDHRLRHVSSPRIVLLSELTL